MLEQNGDPQSKEQAENIIFQAINSIKKAHLEQQHHWTTLAQINHINH